MSKEKTQRIFPDCEQDGHCGCRVCCWCCTYENEQGERVSYIVEKEADENSNM